MKTKIERGGFLTKKEDFLKKDKKPLFLTFPAGEEYKSRKSKEFLEDQLLENKIGRDALFIAVGGGVVLDMVGFLASTYSRGVSYISYPTTLLAMVDASVGGKTGVNTHYSKNSIGSIYPPLAVFIEKAPLITLDQDQLFEGWVEMVKMSLTSKRELFESMEKLTFTKEALFPYVYEALSIKSDIVERDPFEKGERRVLNFGHTIAHAFEMLSSYSISHGKAVAMGIVIESLLSTKFSTLPYQEYERIKELFLPHIPPFSFSHDKFISLLDRDKKSKGKKARFVLLEEIGKASAYELQYCIYIDYKEVLKAIEEVFSCCAL